MSGYRLTSDAQSDLSSIAQYTKTQWGVAQSRRYLSKLRHTIRLLAETPSLGQRRPDVGQEVLCFPCVSHVIYYTVHEGQLVVFGVIHRRMVPLNHLADRDMV